MISLALIVAAALGAVDLSQVDCAKTASTPHNDSQHLRAVQDWNPICLGVKELQTAMILSPPTMSQSGATVTITGPAGSAIYHREDAVVAVAGASGTTSCVSPCAVVVAGSTTISAVVTLDGRLASPALTQAFSVAAVACTSYTYNWGACSSGSQPGSIATQLPSGCNDTSSAVLSQSCGVSSVAVSDRTLTGGSVTQLSATVTTTGSVSSNVSWSWVSGAGNSSSITSGGMYTAPASTASIQTAVVRATSTQDGTKFGTATITIPATVVATTVSVASGGVHDSLSYDPAVHPTSSVTFSATTGQVLVAVCFVDGTGDTCTPTNGSGASSLVWTVIDSSSQAGYIAAYWARVGSTLSNVTVTSPAATNSGTNYLHIDVLDNVYTSNPPIGTHKADGANGVAKAPSETLSACATGSMVMYSGDVWALGSKSSMTAADLVTGNSNTTILSTVTNDSAGKYGYQPVNYFWVGRSVASATGGADSTVGVTQPATGGTWNDLAFEVLPSSYNGTCLAVGGNSGGGGGGGTTDTFVAGTDTNVGNFGAVDIRPGLLVTAAPVATQFTALLANAWSYAAPGIQGMAWAVYSYPADGQPCGTVDSSGMWTPPSPIVPHSTDRTCLIQATSTAQPTARTYAAWIQPANNAVAGATSIVNVSPMATYAPASGGTAAFTATALGTLALNTNTFTTPAPPQTFDWATDVGSINSSGNWSAPGTTSGSIRTATVTATHRATGKKATATVTIAPTGGFTTWVEPADRATKWQPGITYNGGIPARSGAPCATVTPLNSSYNGWQGVSADNTTSDAERIQAAIDSCAPGGVVQLTDGIYYSDSHSANKTSAPYTIMLTRGITLRGTGVWNGTAGTQLQKNFGATMGSYAPSVVAPSGNIPVVRIEPPFAGNLSTVSTSLNVDAQKGALSVTVADASRLAPGMYVVLDELTGVGWQVDLGGKGMILASDDRRVWYRTTTQRSPGTGESDVNLATGSVSGSVAGWYSRYDRKTGEWKKIISVVGNVITFETPIHITYRADAKHNAQLAFYVGDNVGGAYVPHLENAGIENLSITNGDGDGIDMSRCASCWMKNLDVSKNLGSVVINDGYRDELRHLYVHDTAFPHDGGAGYAITFNSQSADCLLEDSITFNFNKNIAERNSGAGTVVAYNYFDASYEGYDSAIGTGGLPTYNDSGTGGTANSWVEVGMNGSHLLGPHHTLFEGNYSHNYDSDNTWGPSIYMTVFRNHLSGFREDFTDTFTKYNNGGAIKVSFSDTKGTISANYIPSGQTVPVDYQFPNVSFGPQRAVGIMAGTYWHTMVGNVLGINMNKPSSSTNLTAGWACERTGAAYEKSLWRLGWSVGDAWNDVDPNVNATTLRHVNYAVNTGTLAVGTGNAQCGQPSYNPSASLSGLATLPNSLYITTGKPSFFGANAWPWVDPVSGTTSVLPSKTCFDAGVPSCVSVVLGTSGTPSTSGQSRTFTATLTGVIAMPTGTVNFYDGTTLLGTGTLNGSGVATYTTSALTVGTHSIYANYLGDATNPRASAKVVQVVN